MLGFSVSRLIPRIKRLREKMNPRAASPPPLSYVCISRIEFRGPQQVGIGSVPSKYASQKRPHRPAHGMNHECVERIVVLEPSLNLVAEEKKNQTRRNSNEHHPAGRLEPASEGNSHKPLAPRMPTANPGGRDPLKSLIPLEILIAREAGARPKLRRFAQQRNFSPAA